jgi:hypothetical protein
MLENVTAINYANFECCSAVRGFGQTTCPHWQSAKWQIWTNVWYDDPTMKISCAQGIFVMFTMMSFVIHILRLAKVPALRKQ